MKELTDVEEEFNEYKTLLTELAEFVAEKQVIFSLSIDYGMGTIGICERHNENIKWLVELAD